MKHQQKLKRSDAKRPSTTPERSALLGRVRQKGQRRNKLYRRYSHDWGTPTRLMCVVFRDHQTSSRPTTNGPSSCTDVFGIAIRDAARVARLHRTRTFGRTSLRPMCDAIDGTQENSGSSATE